LVLHPDQFVVLSSDSPHVIENSIKILETHARILDLLAQPRSSWTVMNVHGGKSDRAERLVSTIQNLPEPIRSRLALENDEHCYGASEILDVCRAAGVPMVFDAHHHVCRERLTSYNDPSIVEMAVAARSTWPIPEWQITHISNGREFFNDPRHSDLITKMPDSFRDVPWIEVEAKHKEVAIQKLHAEWLINGHTSAPAGALQSGKAAGEG
jgi:UV DNA damage endonuclease